MYLIKSSLIILIFCLGKNLQGSEMSAGAVVAYVRDRAAEKTAAIRRKANKQARARQHIGTRPYSGWRTPKIAVQADYLRTIDAINKRYEESCKELGALPAFGSTDTLKTRRSCFFASNYTLTVQRDRNVNAANKIKDRLLAFFGLKA
jgi:hypothetical protein